MATTQELNLNSLPAYFNTMRNPNTGNTMAEDVKAGFGAARPEIMKKALKTGAITPSERAIVDQGAGFGARSPVNIKTVPETMPAAAAVPAAASPVQQAQPVATENVAVNTPTSNASVTAPVAAAQSNAIDPSTPIKPGTGFIQTNGKTIPVGNQEQPSSSQPQQIVVSSSRTTGETGYGARARELAAEEERLMADPNGGIGAGIVARGMANRAKAYSELDAQTRGSAVAEQNADTNLGANQSQALERLRASNRADKTTEADVTNKKLESEQVARVNDLQKQYLNEKDPAKRDAIASQLQALTGKSGNEKFQPVMGKDDIGNTTYLGAFDNRRGEFKPQSQMASAGVPAGYTKIGTSGGRPVYQDAQGNKFIQ